MTGRLFSTPRYTYQTGSINNFNTAVNGLLSGWTISGISTWQAGGYIPAALGNGVPNYNLGLTYTGLPANAKAQGITSSIGDPTYFGTDAAIAILPTLTCNPTINLAHYQRVNGNCFNAPAVGTQGGQNYPYMSAGAYFNNDLALYRTFHIHESQSIQFRASAFDWLNHALPGFSSAGGGGPLGLGYNVDYASKAITKNYNTEHVRGYGHQDGRSILTNHRIEREVFVLACLPCKTEGGRIVHLPFIEFMNAWEMFRHLAFRPGWYDVACTSGDCCSRTVTF